LKSEIGELEREARKIKQLLVENHAAIFESKWAMSRSEIQNLSFDQLEEMYRFFSQDPNRVWKFGQSNEKRAHVRIRETLRPVPALRAMFIQKQNELEGYLKTVRK
jgi:hypothetical protein